MPKAHEGGEGEPQQAVSQEDNGKEYHQDKEEYNLEQETDMTDGWWCFALVVSLLMLLT